MMGVISSMELVTLAFRLLPHDVEVHETVESGKEPVVFALQVQRDKQWVPAQHLLALAIQ